MTALIDQSPGKSFAYLAHPDVQLCSCHPPYRGHHFDGDLRCACGATWAEQAEQPTDCPRAPRRHKRRHMEHCRNGHPRTDEHGYYRQGTKHPHSFVWRCMTCKRAKDKRTKRNYRERKRRG